MKFLLKLTDPAKIDADTLLLFCFEEEAGLLPNLGVEAKTLIKDSLQKEEFKGKKNQTVVISSKGLISSYKIVVTGLGKKDDFDIHTLLSQVAKAIKKAKENNPKKVVLVLVDHWLRKFTTQLATQSVVEATSLALYEFEKYKSKKENEEVRKIKEIILCLPASKVRLAEEGITKGLILAQATNFARDLINEPATVSTPSFLAQVATQLQEKSKGKIKVKIYEKDEVKKLGMGAFLGVSRGSHEPLKFIRLHYKPKSPVKKVVIAGKGITFDTGGLSLKSVKAMETMKQDMSGAAAVLGVFHSLYTLESKYEVVGLIAACENMPSGRALKPGDILTAMNKKTIEVLNTDAEGRLTLADAISFAVAEEKPDEIIDIATLTGACIVALGEDIAGLWGNNKDFLEKIKISASSVGEKIWQLPLEKSYQRLLKSSIADIRNVQKGKFGGAITAALFLSEFVGSTPWVHLDIAGPAFSTKDTPLLSSGGIGFGVRLLLHYLANSVK